MNTANLQTEGLLLAVSALVDAIRRSGVLSDREIADALTRAESLARQDPGRPASVSAANVEAICFPIRFLASSLSAHAPEAFSVTATRVGRGEGQQG